MAKPKTAMGKTWPASKKGQLLSGVLGAVLAYAFVSRALDTGSYWQYLGGLIITGLTASLIVRTFKKDR